MGRRNVSRKTFNLPRKRATAPEYLIAQRFALGAQ
jgi:hypothetical protein